MQKPWLCDVRHTVDTHRLDNDLANEVSLGFGIPVLRIEAFLEDNVDRCTNVDWSIFPLVDTPTCCCYPRNNMGREADPAAAQEEPSLRAAMQ